jgi:hypothetical protein
LNTQLGGHQTRSFAIHNGELYLLQGDGKVFEVHVAGLKQVGDIAQLTTTWASGIYGGYVTEANQTAWGGASAYRCYMASFNNQLHAFINFRSTYKVAKGTDGSSTTGRGIFWATSFDGVNWTDQSPNLPGSGIQATSGSLANWLTDTIPYRISGFTGYNRNTHNKWQAIASGKTLGFARCQPSGLRQHKMIPWIVNSGTMLDTEGTAFGSLHCPLNRGAISGFLFPTFVQKPDHFRTYGSPNQFRPEGIGASGYDYTGCHNFHISGFADEEESKLKLLFTEDFHGQGTWGASLLYELNKSSGWTRKNYLAKSNQLNGLIPIDLYDPEILIPSGDLYNPNPRIDEVNETVSIDYKVYDWPYWSEVTTRLEYSINNGRTWNYAGGQRAVSAGTKLTDPSGTIGGAGRIIWNYGDQLSHSTEYPNVQLRLRAQED